ncbi:TRAP transporter small permease [Haloferax profundi]|uniref:Tripartite ATP-independent periplasmic transporters DctQ component domain-containing protein n=1 Tax=Haloferax profundi TaxID=1544718 RepID=A0A0W1RFR2_9EURY|nr:TRAP transporter small permease [Haloferax profundi]KTG12233.1 hypothetical protein AUR66_19720 [Haloferax profundi]
MVTYDERLSSVLLLAIVVLVAFQILARWIGIAATWTAEVSQLLNVWLVFLLLGRAALEDRHIKIEYFVDKLPASWRARVLTGETILNILAGLTIVGTSLMMAVQFGDVTTEAANIPLPLLYLAGVVGMGGFVLASIRILRHGDDTEANRHYGVESN